MIVSSRCIRLVAPRQLVAPQNQCIHFLVRNKTSFRKYEGSRYSRRVPNRGAKKVAAAKLDELPQGIIPLEPLALEETEPALPTVMLQARSNMRKFENCVLLTRVGGFYEMYFEHADELGPLLNLKVAQRRTGSKANPIMVSMVLLLLKFGDCH